MTESAMEDFINYERKIQLGGVSEAGSGDTGGEKEISEAMWGLETTCTGKAAGGRIEIRREHIGGMWNNRYVPQTGGPGTTVQSALQVHDTGSGTDTRTDSSGSGKNSSSNEGESKRKVDTKPQLSIDKLKQYSYEELVKKPDIKVADISTIDIKSSSRQDIRKKILRDGMADAALRHGLDRRLEVLGPVEDYIAYFIVNSITSELQSVDVLYSANAKKRPAGIISPAITADAATLTGRTISVKQSLQNVNNYIFQCSASLNKRIVHRTFFCVRLTPSRAFVLPKSGPLYVENIPYNAPDNDQNKEYDIYPGRFGIKTTAACAYIIYGSIYDNPCNVNDYKWCKIVIAYSVGKSEFETTECETADSASWTV